MCQDSVSWSITSYMYYNFVSSHCLKKYVIKGFCCHVVYQEAGRCCTQSSMWDSDKVCKQGDQGIPDSHTSDSVSQVLNKPRVTIVQAMSSKSI